MSDTTIRPASTDDCAPLTPGVTLSVEDAGGDIAQMLIEELCSGLRERYGDAVSPFSASDTNAPRAVFIVARLDGRPVGCGAIRRLDDDTAELKRMYVAPSGRRRGIGRRIVAELERHAMEFGYCTIRLETGIKQGEAIALYEACGYRHIAAFGSYVGNPISVCFEKDVVS